MSECDPLDNTAVNQLARTKTQLLLIPHRRKRALGGQMAVAEKLIPAAEDLRRACDAMADEECAQFTDKIAALLAPYCQIVVEQNGARSNHARQLAGRCDVFHHIHYSSRLQKSLPDTSDFSNTPERAIAQLLEYADEGIAVLTRFFSRKEPSFVHPEFAKEPVVVGA